MGGTGFLGEGGGVDVGVRVIGKLSKRIAKWDGLEERLVVFRAGDQVAADTAEDDVCGPGGGKDGDELGGT